MKTHSLKRKRAKLEPFDERALMRWLISIKPEESIRFVRSINYGPIRRLVKDAVNSENFLVLDEVVDLILSLELVLRKAAVSRPKLFADIAGRRDHWPGCLSRFKAAAIHNDAYVKSIKLSERLGLKLEGKQSAFDTPAVRAALDLHVHMEHLRDMHLPERTPWRKGWRWFGSKERKRELEPVRTLPPLRKDTSKAWWLAAKPLIKECFGVRFENHPLFKSYWDSHQFKDTTANLRRAKIRDTIKNDIRQAFRSIAAA